MVRGEDSCEKSVRDETSRSAKPCTEINSGETSSPDHLFLLFVFK
ncbi:hypothetical protein ABE272_08705 [Priestia aryabhattai]